MASKREIDSIFSWVPPPSTVVTVTKKNGKAKSASYEVPGSPAARRPQQRFIDISRLQISNETKGCTPGRRNGHGSMIAKENKAGKGRDAKQSSTLKNGRHEPSNSRQGKVYESEKYERGYGNGDALDIETRTQDQAKPQNGSKSSFIFEDEITEVKMADNVESGNDSYLDYLDLLDEEESERPESVFADERLGKEPVDLERFMRSRKKSEFNPSQKFVSLSYENGIKNNSDNGAFYAKRVDFIKEEKARTKEDKKKSSMRKKKFSEKQKKTDVSLRQRQQAQSNFVSHAKHPHEIETTNNGIPNKKKSVFAEEEVGKEPVNIDDIFGRKHSLESHQDKFLSICFEKDEISSECSRTDSKRSPHGGLYAKKISR